MDIPKKSYFKKVKDKILNYSHNRLFDGDDTLFKEEIKEVNIYGEYGCGKSTSWVLKNTSAEVISVDTSLEWINLVKKENHDSEDRLVMYHTDFGEIGKWGRPKTYEKIDNFAEYTDIIWLKQKPQLILIDGRFRVCCFLTTLKLADEGTKIIFDDYTNRSHYHFVEKYAKRLKMDGRQCLFVVPPKAKINMTKLDEDIKSFRCVMD